MIGPCRTRRHQQRTTRPFVGRRVVDDDLRRGLAPGAQRAQSIADPTQLPVHGLGAFHHPTAREVERAQPAEAFFVAGEGDRSSVRTPAPRALPLTPLRTTVFGGLPDSDTRTHHDVQPARGVVEPGELRATRGESPLLDLPLRRGHHHSVGRHDRALVPRHVRNPPRLPDRTAVPPHRVDHEIEVTAIYALGCT